MGESIRVVHNFDICLAKSHKAENLPLWREIYQKAFPTMRAMVNHRQDGWHQRAGIDRSIILACGKQIMIDEKVRYGNYNDILLEYVSNDRTKAKGWVCKPLAADYIAYAILPLGKCYLLPVIPLQNAWRKYGEKWKKEYFNPVARNEGYKTYSVAVPVGILFKAVSECLTIDFTPKPGRQGP